MATKKTQVITEQVPVEPEGATLIGSSVDESAEAANPTLDPDARDQVIGGQDSGPAPAPSDSPVLVDCAVLCDNIYGKHDDIIQLSEDQAEAARAAGYVDTHPNAIKAIREQG